jgi:outer membrane protein TolC
MKLSLTNHPRCLALAAVLLLGRSAAPAADTNAPVWLTQPMSLTDAVKLALLQNGTLLKSEHELQAAHGLAVQTRSITLPTVRGSAGYLHTEAVEESPFGTPNQPRDQWLGGIRVVQSIYEGGRLRSANSAS